MKRILCITTLSFLVLASGCGKVRSQRLFGSKSGIFSGIGSIEEPVQRNLNQTELVIANRVCSSLKTKRSTLEPQSGKLLYVFKQERRDCSNTLKEAVKFNALVLLVTGDLEYSTSDVTNYFIDVVTDKTPAIASICEQVMDTSTVLSTKKISNANVVLDKLFTVAFSVDANAYDTLQITTRIKDSTGAFSPAHSEEITIATNAAQLGAQFIGVEKDRTQFTPCSGKQFSTLKESWVTALNPL